MNNAKTAQVYGVSVPTISRWNRVGVESGQPPPYGDPSHMVAWYQEMLDLGHFEKGVPASLLAAASRVAAIAPRDEDSKPVDFSKTAHKSRGYSETLELAERNVNAVQAIFDQAVADNNNAVLIGLQKTLNDAVDSHRALMRDRGKIQAEAGETLPKEEVRSAMLELHANISKQFRQGIRAAFPDLSDLAASRELWNVFADGLVDRICLKLSDSNFAAPIVTP
jgi:hypothetical protein